MIIWKWNPMNLICSLRFLMYLFRMHSLTLLLGFEFPARKLHTNPFGNEYQPLRLRSASKLSHAKLHNQFYFYFLSLFHIAIYQLIHLHAVIPYNFKDPLRQGHKNNKDSKNLDWLQWPNYTRYSFVNFDCPWQFELPW